MTLRHLTVILACVLVGYPLLIAPSSAVLTLGVMALAFCALGLLLGVPLLAAGAGLALAEYSLALWLSGGPPRLVGAVLFGVGVILLLETGDFGRRARRAALGPGVVTAQLRSWALFGALAALAALAVIGVARAASGSMPLPWAPAIAATGAAAALVAVAFTVRRGNR